MDKAIQNTKERRRNNRLELDTEVKLSVIGKHKIFRGRSKNLSPKGIAFYTNERNLKPGMLLEMVLKSGGKTTPPLEAIIKIIHIKKMPNSHRIEVGASIKTVKTVERPRTLISAEI